MRWYLIMSRNECIGVSRIIRKTRVRVSRQIVTDLQPEFKIRILDQFWVTEAYSNRFLRVFHVRFLNSDNLERKLVKFSTKAMVLMSLS